LDKIYEFSIRSFDGTKLFGKTWQTDKKYKGTICLIHGIGEHSGRYKNLAKTLNIFGYNVCAIDLRGHGFSDGKRGHTPSFSAWMTDITYLYQYAQGIYPGSLYIYGHSLGGNIALNYILQNPNKFKGAIITSPHLKLAFSPPKFKVLIAYLIKNILPSMSLATKLNVHDLSHVKSVINEYVTDPLVHDRITANTFVSIMRSGQDALDKAHTLSIPTLLMHGEKDKITSPIASQKFARLAGSLCTLKIWIDAYHELHNENIKNLVFETIGKWLEQN